MPVTAVVGCQYGDEGKGRIIDFLAGNADLVIRFQGGDNAGHTVVNDKGRFQLHLIPSGIFNPKSTSLIGTGVVVNPQALLKEIEELESSGIDTSGILVSNRAHMLLPYHRILDGIEEESRGSNSIGTTNRGIGPAYRDKTGRTGVRIGDLEHLDYLKSRLELQLQQVNQVLSRFDTPLIDLDSLMEQCVEWSAKLSDRIVETIPLIKDFVESNQQILLEGQLGSMKDLDWGTYPFVTSSNPTAAFAGVGAGLPYQHIKDVIGVAKAYQTSVGEGPFPGELLDPIGDKLRDIGKEYGVTTGRSRRTGWYDSVAVQHSVWLNGMTSIALTKLDVLDTFEEIKICNAYQLPGGDIINYVPDTPVLEKVTPVLETWPGWKQPTTHVRRWKDLPQEARDYLERLQELAGIPIGYVSVGAEREAMFAV
ncbi:MAG TPA: adenylosuccinate synthase [Anaerolineales bacterium]|jgi:adenylosuccinate synthase|nr:adenylosuccinate synthase [Anaerolineaceae bacterium]HJO91584.1 adenylosuccinate synthase [Anaerolineales bacterium]|tara:strand:+ start:1852 stop:3120 length:1269 start_codon:yes stop_codon:yes gene_type:complete